jgi:hypothetical protein
MAQSSRSGTHSPQRPSGRNKKDDHYCKQSINSQSKLVHMMDDLPHIPACPNSSMPCLCRCYGKADGKQALSSKNTLNTHAQGHTSSQQTFQTSKIDAATRLCSCPVIKRVCMTQETTAEAWQQISHATRSNTHRVCDTGGEAFSPCFCKPVDVARPAVAGCSGANQQ